MKTYMSPQVDTMILSDKLMDSFSVSVDSSPADNTVTYAPEHVR